MVGASVAGRGGSFDSLRAAMKTAAMTPAVAPITAMTSFPTTESLALSG